MFRNSNRALFWAPRALCILLIAFVSLFALDVFEEGLGFWQTLAALGIHLLPAYILLAALIVAWRWEWVGTATFAAFGIGFALVVRGPWWTKLMFSVPCFMTAWLFLLSWQKKKAQHSTAH